MKNFLKSGLLVAVAVMSLAGSSQAGVLNLGGVTAAGGINSPFAVGVAWSLSTVYTPNPAGTTAVVTAATLKIGTETFAFVPTTATFKVGAVAGFFNDKLDFASQFNDSTPGGIGDVVANGGSNELNLTVFGTDDLVGGTKATDSNIQLLGGKIGNAMSGALTFGTSTVFLSGVVPAPEPGSIAVLCGLGLIVGRRVLKSRSSKKQEVAA